MERRRLGNDCRMEGHRGRRKVHRMEVIAVADLEVQEVVVPIEAVTLTHWGVVDGN